MSEERDAFIENLAKQIGYNPTEKMAQQGEAAAKYYRSLRGGDVAKHVTQTVALYTKAVLPKLSLIQALELAGTVHTIIETVLTYLVEDGLIKEE